MPSRLTCMPGARGSTWPPSLFSCCPLRGFSGRGDVSVVVAAENVHRAKTFKPLDTSNIIFGDDALAIALGTKAGLTPRGRYSRTAGESRVSKAGLIREIAGSIFELVGQDRMDGLIIDNQLGKFQYKVPATAARVQHALVELMYPEAASKGTFGTFKGALEFYNTRVKSFAFDIMTSDSEGVLVERVARSYVESGKF